MNGYNTKHRNEPFRDWVNQFPVNMRVSIMEKIGRHIGKSFHAIKSYKNLYRDIGAIDSAGIQEATKSIAKEEGVGTYVSAMDIYPELYKAFKQGDTNGVPHGKEATTPKLTGSNTTAAITQKSGCTAEAGIS